MTGPGGDAIEPLPLPAAHAAAVAAGALPERIADISHDSAGVDAEVGAATNEPLLLVAIPYNFARTFGTVLVDAADGRISVALREGADPRALLEVRRVLGRPFDVDIVEAPAFDQLLSDRYSRDGGAAAEVAGALAIDSELDMLASDLPTADDLLASADDAPAIRLVNGIIADAARQQVSDIHIEPYESGLIVRFRLDGVLRETLRMPAHVAPVLVNRIKVMARLDIAERRIPQDGRISLSLGGKLFDVRVSTLPARAGERVVLRILDRENAGIALDVLGMDEGTMAVFREALAEPNGVVLVTGPTGSGKTTTLYAALRQLNDGKRNILTVEDPVEYAIDGVGQTQVNAKVGLSFANGLRAILRQDPDVVLVGEVRDRETAEIAVQASLTGHLVLTTVHTNDAVGAITRLRDMKVEPFLLASTLRAVIAQRLVRKLCQECRRPVQATALVASLMGFEPGTVVYEPDGCAACNGTGYQGRIGVYEAVKIDDTIRRLINDGGDEAIIARHAFVNAPTLGGAARRMARAGLTAAEEAIRITRRSGDDG